MPAVVPGAQPKFAVRLIGGNFVAGETDEERFERWDICEDLAQQLVAVATADASTHPQHGHDQTLRRVCDGVARKGWCSSDELIWIQARLRTLLAWCE
jgi:hypothetical protein